ncbi:MAG: exodeoxyribonuclease VII large subunit [Phycisphaerae bacterium]|nr:exodeoxyribonuclease VII large subunit [Phycisphaerae bacterium]MDW8261132.1 exodeoxyribonuclease VII large subunit [Phycisphaerales bacterium]
MSQPGFFEFRNRLTAAGRRAEASSAGAQPITVSELTSKIEAVLRTGLPGSLLVRGEISNLNHHRSSGHLYFTLKDESACVDCVMFRSDAERLKFTPVDGAEVLARGMVRVYAQRGRYQLYVSSLAPLGKGALELAFQQLKEKLEREGLFAPERKRPLPRFPGTVALITGRETAALQDMLKVLSRFPFIRVLIAPVLVQGAGAAGQIAWALREVGALEPPNRPDLIILARGGGSLEDLWAFNEEPVARAIARCPIPVVTGIGHEVDVSIADLVADYHAHTPTEAAQVVVSHWKMATEAIGLLARRHARAIRQQVMESWQRLRLIEQHEFFRRPLDLVDRRRQRLDDLQKSLGTALTACARRASDRLAAVTTALERRHPRLAVRLAAQRLAQLAKQLPSVAGRMLSRKHQALSAMESQLKAVSPQATLGRGYSITMRKGGDVVRSAGEVKPGDVLVTRFADGQAESVVRDQKQMRLFE